MTVSAALAAAREKLGINGPAEKEKVEDGAAAAGQFAGNEGVEAETDNSPAISSLTVVHNGQHTDINARVATPTGYANKRTVIPGHLTAKKLACAIANVANW